MSTKSLYAPNFELFPLGSSNFVEISGPSGKVGPSVGDEAGEESYLDIVAGRTVSTYPHIPGNSQREGDPIADRYGAQIFSNRIIAAVADGCNWGTKPKEAAVRAESAFIEYVHAQNENITDIHKAGLVLINAFEYAHNSILEGKAGFWDAGTTTLLGGILLEVNKGNDTWAPEWAFVCASVGDCKAFLCSNGVITEITQGNRKNVTDARDCGGRIGPHDDGEPDLRNLNVYISPCLPGDIIIMCTDGVYDNLDPEHLGKLPKDLPKDYYLSADTWEELEPMKAMYAKNTYMVEKLSQMLRESEDSPTIKVTPKEAVDVLIKHCVTLTQKSRDFSENNKDKRLPQNFQEYPGKMDHTTCLCFRVGRVAVPKNTITPRKITVPEVSMTPFSINLANFTNLASLGSNNSPRGDGHNTTIKRSCIVM
eukprot:Phypoly_transcript_08345.p1 GENE.Phypoly_transcript_08345~~Phypoly_transcript_08345.p1  ORF type:complete len:424 (+),score=60.08 Phypoly_transcript_08345:205-1476(+)